jgi:hypothetical protein
LEESNGLVEIEQELNQIREQDLKQSNYIQCDEEDEASASGEELSNSQLTTSEMQSVDQSIKRRRPDMTFNDLQVQNAQIATNIT